MRRRTPSGRVAELAVVTDAGTYHVRGDRVRWVLAPADGNPAILRSALFELELVRDGGQLTRVAAAARASATASACARPGPWPWPRQAIPCQEILAHYYPGATPESGADRCPQER